eukprot:CAMPEP_0172862556 /NCGR_PEP_ID=MMETSP1075-20121228/74590_1 /TAXON_ID=2916 /ORGANISM="Ceratium fusus, Strain PA161109" /LENGTH=66 /DNA_ID=CAMNT_0013710925 /DNA_START=144 /DNA_END=344 /DNA_ORIENTATION=-
MAASESSHRAPASRPSPFKAAQGCTWNARSPNSRSTSRSRDNSSTLQAEGRSCLLAMHRTGTLANA